MSGGAGEGQFEFSGCESPESAITSSAVVSVLDPVGDRVAELCSSAPRAGFEDIALQQCPESFPGCVLAGGSDANHGAVVSCHPGNRLCTAGTKLRSPIGLDNHDAVGCASRVSILQRRDG